jgi:PKD repeat protein
MSSRAMCAALLLLAGGCKKGAPGGLDGGGGGPADAFPSEGLQPLALDFAITGCTRYDTGAARCYGSSPLTLSFSPVTSPSLTQFRWSFGDGTSSSDRAPKHTYVLPDTYDVTLVGAGDAGTASSTQHVSVSALGAGSPCDVDGQCGTGLTCVCGGGTDCGPGFSRGLCTAPCGAGGCSAGSACAALAPAPGDGGAGVSADAGAPRDGGDDARDGGAAARDGGDAAQGGDAGEDGDAGGGVDGGVDARADGSTGDGGASPSPPTDFRQPVCLASCKQDVDCPTGLACRQLPSGDATAGTHWVGICFPPALGDVGQPCRGPDGALSSAACLTGTCANVGALGLCTASCDATDPCPSGSACARFGDGRSMCLAICAATGDCARDPLLACVAPGGAGTLGFTVADGTPGTTYCAPRHCTTGADCAPAGVCTAGYCR